jgi:hypothetical protein
MVCAICALRATACCGLMSALETIQVKSRQLSYVGDFGSAPLLCAWKARVSVVLKH